jgi:hypothetical protein
MGHNRPTVTQMVAIPFFVFAAVSLTLTTWLFKECHTLAGAWGSHQNI